MKYHYIILQDKADFFRVSWNDIHKISDTEYYDYFPCGANTSVKKIFQIHFSQKIRKQINLPFKSFWNRFFYTKKVNKPLCFLFSSRYAFFMYNGLIDSLRKRYPGSKYVCFFQDIVSTHNDIDINDVKRVFDMVISYDEADAKKYSLIYHPTVYSTYPTEEDKSIPYTDVYFVGAAKNRLNDIIETYDALSSKQCKCDFYITGCPIGKQINREGVHYIQRLSYIDNIKHLKKAKAILEILQHGAGGYSLRQWEAIAYNKYFITNNTLVESLHRENEGILSVTDTNIKSIIDNESIKHLYSETWGKQISVQEFLKFLDSNL